MNATLIPLAQERAWKTLAQFSASLPQGLILLGPAGVGKRLAARALFQLLHCHNPSPNKEPCGSCIGCRKVAEGKNADLIEIGPKGETIPVDDLREMKKSLFFAPLEGRIRFVIIDQAHKLNAASANTLLKTLEEPPAHTKFLLITHERGLLLPTIVSRCQFVHFAPLGQDVIKAILERQNIEIPSTILPLCLDLMGSGMERAPFFSNEKTLKFLEEAQQILKRSRLSRQETIALSEQLSSEDWKLELFLDLMICAAHREALSAAMPSHRRAEAWSAAQQAMTAARLKRRFEHHANKKLVALATAELMS